MFYVFFDFIFNYFYRNNLHMDGFVRHLLLATLAENDVALSAENLKYPLSFYFISVHFISSHFISFHFIFDEKEMLQ